MLGTKIQIEMWEKTLAIITTICWLKMLYLKAFAKCYKSNCESDIMQMYSWISVFDRPDNVYDLLCVTSNIWCQQELLTSSFTTLLEQTTFVIYVKLVSFGTNNCRNLSLAVSPLSTLFILDSARCCAQYSCRVFV